MVTAYGLWPAIAGTVQSGDGNYTDGRRSAQSSSQNTSHDVEEASDATLSSPLLTDVSFLFPFPVF